MKNSIKNKSKNIAISSFRGIFIFGICFIIIYPLIMKLAISLRSAEDIYDNSIIYIPKHFSISSFATALRYLNFSTVFINSTVICTISALLHCISCTLTAYSLAKFKMYFKPIIFGMVLIAFVVPPSLISLPTYVVFKNFDFLGLLQIINIKGINLTDNPLSLFLLYGTANALKSGLYIYLLIQFFRNLPKELDEAAYVDGASLFKTMLHINLPSARVMITTVFLFTFVWQWTDLQYTAMFFKNFETFSAKMAVIGRTFVQVANDLGTFNALQISQYVNASSLMFILPLIVLYAFSNRFFVQGIERSGIVG